MNEYMSQEDRVSSTQRDMGSRKGQESPGSDSFGAKALY